MLQIQTVVDFQRESINYIIYFRELITILNNCADVLKIDRPSSEEMEEIVRELDDNSDGKVSENEFQKLIESVLQIMAKIEEK